MDRRSFIKKAALTAAGSFIVPYILPSGRLFANSPNRVVNHVVFVLFGGGLRQQETVEQAYISSQAGQNTSGNILNNMLAGSAPTQNLVYTQWNPILSNPLMNQGTLFREMRYENSPTGHYNAHTDAITGQQTATGLNLNVNPEFPTIFEYFRKHTGAAATDAWWISDSLGPYPSLNYSRHPNYGALYGANYLQPSTLLFLANQYFGGNLNYQPDDVERIDKVRNLLDRNFERMGEALPGIQNNRIDRERIKQFILNTLDRSQNGTLPIATPTNTYSGATGDLVNISAAWQVLETFKPSLTVINTTNSDVCHTNFSQYIQNLHKADYGVGWLWDKIQNDPILANNTILICMPEHGRNLQDNNVFDSNGLGAFDHTGDQNSRRIFSLIAGPAGKIVQGGGFGSSVAPVGRTIDIVPTIAHALGFYNDIAGMVAGQPLLQAFV